MSENEQLIHRFYTAFAQGDVQGMLACYHPKVCFKDPAFGELKEERAMKMWEMLLSSDSGLQVGFDKIEASKKSGKANWRATYFFGPKKRRVVNNVRAHFKFKDNKIIEHTDDFDLWRWTRQALGVSGVLLGWTGYMQAKIQKMTQKK